MGIKLDSKTNTWTATYSKRHPKTRIPLSRRRIGIKTRAEAKRKYDELVVTVNDLILNEGVPTWKEVLEGYLSRIIRERELTKATIYKRDKVLRKHTLPKWENLKINEITTQDIRDLLESNLSSLSETHRKFFLKGIRGVFQDAVERGLIQRNPTPIIRFKINDKIKSVLNEEQILVLLRKAKELDWPWFPHYATALFTGMRNGELYALTWDKVNFEKRQVLVDCSWSSKDGLKSTKSGDDRLVEIPNPLLPILQELKLQSEFSEFVLPRLHKWDQGEQARDLRLFLNSIGLPLIRFHDLRASWATLLLSKGVPPSQVMAMGGWKDMDTMMIYMRKAGIPIKGATSCLDNMQLHGKFSSSVLTFPS